MSRKPLAALFTAIFIATVLPALAEDAKPAAKVNFTEHVAPILQNRCNSCHNGDKKKGGLALDSFGGTMAGGGSGKVVEPGDPDNSRLYLLCAHQEEPKMPPMQPKIPDAELNTIKAWIEAGAPEASGSVVAMKKPKLDFKLDPNAMGKPVGDPAMPVGVITEPVVLSPRPNAVLALAASPWAPLVAVAGHKQILLYDTNKNRLAGVLPFPEGNIHCLRFTRDGGMLLAGGGRGGQLGRVVVWDVKTGKRLFEVGKEYDVVLAADISPDRSMVALGGPSKILRVYNVADGELAYETKKHTEWVTAVEFSPDGVLLASGDRNGGLVVWEAPTGREFYDLRGHGGMITEVSWRLDSNVLASSSEDTTVRLWEMQGGTQIKSWGAHGGGCTSVKFAKDGRLVTTGRDAVAKVFDQNGAVQKQTEGYPDLTTRAVFLNDEQSIVAGDYTGQVRRYELKEGKRIAEYAANPLPIAARLQAASAALVAATAAADVAGKELAALQANVKTTTDALTQAQAALPAAQAEQQKTTAALNAAEAVYNQKAGPAETANAALWKAQFEQNRATDMKAAADSALAAAVDAAAKAAQTFAETKSDRDKALSEKAAAVKASAEASAKTLADQLAAAQTVTKTAQAAYEKAEAERKTAEAPLPDLRKAAQAAAALVPQRTNELTAATAAKTAADKALADRTPVLQAQIAQAAALKAEVEALTVEQKAAAGANAPMTTASAAK